MKQIKILGTGCANCKTTLKLIEAQARTMGVDIQLEKVEALSEIMRYGVMSTPGVVIDDVVVHSGGVPSRSAIDGWLEGDSGCGSGNSAATTGKCCG